MRTQGSARFTGHHGAADIVNDAISKELVPNDVAVPKWNPISVIFVVSLCELALVAGFYLAWRMSR